MKLRIISGSLGGRAIDAPHGHKTHPMSEQIRGALFNVLGDVSGLTLLDAFTGSGAIAVEAVSRGAKNVIAIDSDKNAFKTAHTNASNLNIVDKLKVTQANISSWIDNNPDAKFDVVICDPPYDNVKPALLSKVADTTQDGGIVVLSLPPKTDLNLGDNFNLVQSKSYGDATLAFYRKTG